MCDPWAPKPWYEVFGSTEPNVLSPYVTAEGKNLNFGCAGRLVEGWVNYDPEIKHPNVITYWQQIRERGPYNTIVAWHVLEHIQGSRDLMRTVAFLADQLAPGGTFIAACPHAQSREAFDSPFHVRRFTHASWGYFTKMPYEVPYTMGFAANEGCEIPNLNLLNVYQLINPKHLGKSSEELDSIWGGYADSIAVFARAD